MKTSLSQGKIFISLILVFGLLFQIVGIIRYINRLPDDWLGIGLYLATIVAFSMAISLHFIRSKNQI